MRKRWFVCLLFFYLATSISQAQTKVTFTQIPDSLLQQANVVFLGKYRSYRRGGGRMANGAIIHRLIYGLKKVKISKGAIKTSGLTLSSSYKFKVGQHYWVLLKLSQHRAQKFATTYVSLDHPIFSKEIVAILPAQVDD